jgi:predicted transcriptional regulator
MRLSEAVRSLGLGLLASGPGLDRELAGGYVSDLMSDVIAHAEAGDLWLTVQIHANIVAVAAMKELAGIVLTGGRQPEAETLRKAAEKKVTLLASSLPAFELSGRLYQLGLRGRGSDAAGGV